MSLPTYSDFQNSVSSEKLTLAILYASKRLMAFVVHSGSVYKLSNFDVAVIDSLKDSGTAYTEKTSIAALTTSSFYNDRANQTLYIKTTGSDNPNGRFIVLEQKLFFSNAPITLPSDLSTADEVYFEPMIKSTSSFGVGIDTINQTSEAIEGSGTLTLINDGNFWPTYFDRLTFENKKCEIYSYNRKLPLSEKLLLFRGLVEKKSYSTSQIQFSLKDLLTQLKASPSLSNISDLSLRNSPDLDLAKQRMIFGRVYGHRPINVDEVLTGYPITGTVSVNTGSATLTGSGTSFLTQLSPNDTLVLAGVDYTIAAIASATSLTLSESYAATTNLSGASTTVKPDQPKRWTNRVWNVAGHALCQPTTTIQAGCSITRLIVSSTKNIYDGDYVYIGTLGSGELVQVLSVVSNILITLANSLTTIPSIGTTLFKPAVQNVRINDVPLRYYRDYTFNATTATITLGSDAEASAAPVKQMANNLVFTNTSRTVTGTSLDTILRPGDMVAALGQSTYFEILSVDSPTSATLRTASTYTSTAKGLFKTIIFDPSNSVLTCDVLGRTDDGTSTGNLIDTAPKVVQQLLIDAGLSTIIDTSSFTAANDICYEEIGFAIPETYGETSVPTYRDIINKVNQSVFGYLTQTNSFTLSYFPLQIFKGSATRFEEADILKFSAISAADRIVKTSIVYYQKREYDYLTRKQSVSTQQKTSSNAIYILGVDRERSFQTYLVKQIDAERAANRWAFILENSSSIISITTKLQGASLEIGDTVEISHRKLYTRFGSSNTRKLGLVESVKKSGNSVELTIVDLSNAFNRIAAINSGTTSWVNSNEDTRLYGGYFTDAYGVINDDAESVNQNLIW